MPDGPDSVNDTLVDLGNAPPAGTSGASGDADQWRVKLGPLAFERRRGARLPWHLRRGRPRSWKLRLVRYGLVVVALLVAMQFLGSQFRWLHLPHLSSPIGPASTTVTNIGPVIRDHLAGIPNPAPASANYAFNFQIQKTRTIVWVWTVGYADTYYVSGEGYARVLLNPGGGYWKQNPGAFNLQVLSRPAARPNGSVKPGSIALVVTLPQPDLPRGVGGVRLDPASGPVSGAAHWIGCPFHVSCPPADMASVYFSQQVETNVAYEKLACVAGRDHGLAAVARQEAYATIYGWLAKFSQALHYNLRLTIDWTARGSNETTPLPRFCPSVAGSVVTAP